MARAAQPARRTRPTKRHRMSWREWTLEVRHTPDYLSAGTDHLEIIVKAPKDAPIPITTTGYRSHFLPPGLIVAAGGPVAFVTRWLDSEATSKAWAKTETKWRQLCFDLVMPKLLPERREPRAAARPVRRKPA